MRLRPRDLLIIAALFIFPAQSWGVWQIELVDVVGDVGTDADVATDYLGRVHVAYYDETNNTLKYAQRRGGAWLVSVVDNGGVSPHILHHAHREIHGDVTNKIQGNLALMPAPAVDLGVCSTFNSGQN